MLSTGGEKKLIVVLPKKADRTEKKKIEEESNPSDKTPLDEQYTVYLISLCKRLVRFKSSEGEFRLDLRKLDGNGLVTSTGILLDVNI